MGIPLHEAIEQTTHMRAGGSGPPEESGTPRERVPTESELVRQNEASMQQLNQMMRGL